jgi:hypothetical protein
MRIVSIRRAATPDRTGAGTLQRRYRCVRAE